MTDTQNVYPITNKPGACVIFNMESFENDKQERRDGTEYDKSKIESTFKNFGYDVHPVHNPTKNDIDVTMEKILGQNHSTSSSFICFILTHGTTPNQIVTHDNIRMHLNDIVQKSDVPDLHGKPKIFVIQACRGKHFDRGIVVGTKGCMCKPSTEFDDMMLYPRKPDYLLIFATPPGYLSYRTPTGSQFIQMLCDTLQEERNNATVCVLLQRLSLAVSYLPFSVVGEPGSFLQVPYFMSTLRRSLILHHSASSGDMQFMTTYDQKKVDRIPHDRLFQSSVMADDHLYQKSLLTKTTGCYDLSSLRFRHCLVINKTTAKNFDKATEDYHLIEKTMESLNFHVKISNNETWESELKKCMEHYGEKGCFFCFIQIDANDDTSNNEFLTKFLLYVKNEICLLDKPKMYIIQPYNTKVIVEQDGPSYANRMSSKHPVRISKESDVLMVQMLPVRARKRSFIELFCDAYTEHAGQVPMMGFLERILPGKFKCDWLSLQPTVCSTMRKHLLITNYDDENASFQSDVVEMQGTKLIASKDTGRIGNSRVKEDAGISNVRDIRRLQNSPKSDKTCSLS